MRLFEQAEIAKFTPVELREYEDSLKVYRDWYSVMWTKEKEGFAAGEKAGIEKARAEARNEKLSMAAKMKADGMSTDFIAKYSGLTADEIEKL
jgi:predicted transposase/invertase (TIGR01784 family)